MHATNPESIMSDFPKQRNAQEGGYPLPKTQCLDVRSLNQESDSELGVAEDRGPHDLLKRLQGKVVLALSMSHGALMKITYVTRRVNVLAGLLKHILHGKGGS